LPERAARQVDNRLFMACALAWGAGLIHVEAAIGHAAESTLYAVLFTLLAATQFAWGTLAYRRPVRGVLLAGAILSVSVIVVWIASRTTGLPIGPDPGSAEAVGPFDSLATADEVVLIVLVVVRLRELRDSVAADVAGKVASAVALWLILLSSLSIVVADHVH
jgi:hypothetical protein